MGEQKRNNTENGKDWCTPQLTVLVRSKTEERVLFVCKVAGHWIAALSNNHENCTKSACAECTSIAAS